MADAGAPIVANRVAALRSKVFGLAVVLLAELLKDVKGGAPKVGGKVTGCYKTVATEIETKPAATTEQKKSSR